MTGTERRRGYSYPAAAADWTPEQRRSYTFGIQQDAHVRHWFAKVRADAAARITTESLLAAIRSPVRA